MPILFLDLLNGIKIRSPLGHSICVKFLFDDAIDKIKNK